MKEFIFDFDINKVEFDERTERYTDDEYGTTTLYFIAPKEWLGDLYPEAVSAEISVEYPSSFPEAIYTSVMMSPTRTDTGDYFEDYDWFDIVLLPSEVEQLMNLAAKYRY